MTATATVDAPPHHYPALMATRDLTPDDVDLIAEATKAARALRAAQVEEKRASDALYDFARAHWRDIDRIGWRPFARAVGVDEAGIDLVNEATLRAWTADLKKRASRTGD